MPDGPQTRASLAADLTALGVRPGDTVLGDGWVVDGTKAFDGGRRWITYTDVATNSDDFGRLGAAFEDTGASVRGRVGCPPRTRRSRSPLSGWPPTAN
jgi:aminoglycoside N3'-acetyltransferase